MEFKPNPNCCKPFPNNDKKCSLKLRKLTDKMIEKLVSMKCTVHLDTSLKICDSCRLSSYRPNPTGSIERLEHCEYNEELPSTSRNILDETPSAVSLISKSSQDSDLPDYCRVHNIELFNNGIAGINVSPISTTEVNGNSYRNKKYADIVSGVRRQLFNLPLEDESEELHTLKKKAAEFDEVIDKLKDKFKEPECSRNEKNQILTVLPNSWSVQKIADQFETNKYIPVQAKQLAAEQGVLATPTNKSGNRLDPAIANEVVQFFDDDDISRAMPGQRDYVSIKRNGKRQQIQKRLLLGSLRETYYRFNEISEHKIGFSKFAALRPKHCKLLNTSGSHNVCVCTIHENIDLMLHSLKKLTFKTDCKQLFEKLMCNSSLRSKHCYLRECENCPTQSEFESIFLEELEQHLLSEISFEQWVTTDRCNLETILKPVDEFVAYFSEKFEKLLTHDYIKTKQSQFLKDTKASLKEGEIVIICDFAENYSFVLQDAVQSHHWNNDQATIHPFVVYYMDSGTLKNLSFVVISEVLKHDTIAVQVFISKLLMYLNQRINIIKKAIFMSDGAASQYKNRKKFASLCKFKEKYNIDTEWHFFATSHGKGPCDAIGGTLKRMATRASLAKQHEHPITSAKTLYDWASKRNEENFTTITFCYVSQEEYEEGAAEWDECYRQTKMIPGTQKYHSFIPISYNKIAAKLFSTDEVLSFHSIYKQVK